MAQGALGPADQRHADLLAQLVLKQLLRPEAGGVRRQASTCRLLLHSACEDKPGELGCGEVPGLGATGALACQAAPCNIRACLPAYCGAHP